MNKFRLLGKNYMLNTLSIACVKNVYYLPINYSKNSVSISTTNLINIYLFTNWVQKLTNKLFTLPFTSTLSTTNNSNLSLLNKSFTYFPQSLLLRLRNEI